MITIVNEDELLGTGGGIKGIARAIDCDTLVVINGDAVFDFDLGPVLAAHRASSALGTLALRWVPPDAPFGRVGIDSEGRLWQIAEVAASGIHPADLVFGAFTGVQIIERELIDRIPDGHCDILRSAYRSILDENGAVFGHFVPRTSAWFDVGTPERYLEAHQMILEGRLAVSHLPQESQGASRIHPTVIVPNSTFVTGPCAVMDGVLIGENVSIGPNAFIGSGAVIEAGSKVENAVVWSGAVVEKHVSNDVVLPPQDAS